MTRFIRYLAATDLSPIGLIALEYLRGLLRIGPVRLASMTGGLQDAAWQPYAQLLATPMDGDFVNVVCCDPSRWTWLQKVQMPKRTLDGKLVLPGEVASGWQELYTEGVHNVLIAGEKYPHKLSLEQATTARRCQALVVPEYAMQVSWNSPQVARRRRLEDTTVIPVPVTDIAALRAAVIPLPKEL